MAGPIARNYKSGSIIYFEGDISEEIYILKQGRVILLSTMVETGKESKENLQPGEFFGVRSTLGHFPREETAQTLTDSTVLVLKLSDFEALMSKNFRLVIKMLRVFSNQLRDVGKRVRNILGDTDLRNPSTELLKLAEYYYQNNNLDYAKYAYNKFLTDYPGRPYADRAQQMLQNLQQGGNFPGRYQPLYEQESFSDDYSEEIDVPETSAGTVSQEQTTLGAGSSMPVSPELGKQEFDGDFALDSAEIPFGMDTAPGSNSLSSQIESAEQMLLQGQTEDALNSLQTILEQMQGSSSSAPKEDIAKVLFLTGKIYLDKKNIQQANACLSRVVKEFAQTSSFKPALLYMGRMYHSAGKADTARNLYQRVVATGQEDQWTLQAKELLDKLGAAHA